MLKSNSLIILFVFFLFGYIVYENDQEAGLTRGKIVLKSRAYNISSNSKRAGKYVSPSQSQQGELTNMIFTFTYFCPVNIVNFNSNTPQVEGWTPNGGCETVADTRGYILGGVTIDLVTGEGEIELDVDADV